MQRMTTREEADFSAKQEGSASDHNKTMLCRLASSSSTSWSRLKDPRIVRVSRAFGGKDRHSKVCTVRGLRDRRVRLSVPTAIQLYDLQDRLGLNQPSKVVDWLLNAAKHEIDELPPLQMPPGNFPQNLHPLFGIGPVASSQSEKGLKTSNDINWYDPLEQPPPNIMYSDVSLKANSKDAAGDEMTNRRGRDQSWTRNEDEKECNLEGSDDHHGAYAASSANNYFQRPNHSSLVGLMNNSMTHNAFLRWDPSNLSLSHGGSHGLPPRPEEFRNFNIGPQPSAVNMASGSQIVVYPPPPGIAQSYKYFPFNVTPAYQSDAVKHINNLQMFSSTTSQTPLSNFSLKQPVDHSSSQPVRPLHFSI